MKPQVSQHFEEVLPGHGKPGDRTRPAGRLSTQRDFVSAVNPRRAFRPTAMTGVPASQPTGPNSLFKRGVNVDVVAGASSYAGLS